MRVESNLRRVKGWVWSRGVRTLDTLAYTPWAPQGWAARRRAGYWERMAAPIHEQWGRGEWDFPLLERIIVTHQVRSVLDVGCGTGRLFSLYQRLGVVRVLGLDISAEALAVAGRDYPTTPTLCGRLEDVILPVDPFDLVVSNRVLQHIGRDAIAGVVARLCAAGRLLYLNELSASDELAEEFFMARHDYGELLDHCGWGLVEQGQLLRQTYRLYAVQ